MTETREFRIFEAKADRETGEWIAGPEDTGARIAQADWHALTDEANVHFETFEYDGRTEAVRIEWTD